MPQAPSPVFEPIPRHTMFQIGQRRDGQDPTNPFVPITGIIKREVDVPGALDSPGTVPSVLLCLVRNYGDAAFTIAVEDSANNDLANVPGQAATADPYAARSIRVDGADVAGGTLVVEPGGAAVFLIEWAFGDDDYIKFEVDDELAFGELSIAHYGGVITPRDREQVP